MRRSGFLAGAASWASCSTVARATGGQDVDPAQSAGHDMRVLLATNAEGTVQPEVVDPYRFRFNGRTFRGRFEVVQLSDGRAALVNVVPIDAYLYGVVTKEASAGWPRAALATQAIVARTYVLTKRRPGRPYDVTPGETDQVYGGIESESVEAREAVDATSGLVVTYEGTLAHLAFGSCCGGHTADAAEVWGNDYPYLHGVADPHCVIAPDYRWQRDVPYEQFVRALGASAAQTGALQRVELRDLDDSGRARRIALIGDRATVELKTTAFRSAVGNAVVRSTLLQSITIERDAERGTVRIAGSGYGHGVGLCQWGTRAMAAEGDDATRILQFYFPQTAIGRA